MDNSNKKKVEMTIECNCVGLDEALEKVARLAELLKVIDEHKDLIALLQSSKADEEVTI